MFDVYTEQYIEAAVKVIQKTISLYGIATKMGRTNSFWDF